MFKENRMKVKFMQSIGCSLTIAAMLSLSACGGGDKQQAAQQMVPEIATMTVTSGPSQLEMSYPATIKGKTDIEIRPQVSGTITKVHVDEGQRVHRGQVLFTLDQVTLKAAVDQAQQAVNAAKVAVATAQQTADTKKKLLEKNIISQYDYQIAANNLASAKAQLAQANAALVSARKNLSYTVVTSPSDGVVGSIPNREGSLASPSSAVPLTTISDNGQVYAYFSLTEKDILHLVGNGERTLENAIAQMPPVQLKLADGTVFSEVGKVATISGVLDSSTGSANVRALFNNPSRVLRSGSTGNVIIPQNSENVIVIPQKATFELQDRRYVYVLNDSNKTVSTPITVLDINDGQNFVVTEGLKNGDRIAIEGVGTVLKEGMPVKPKKAGAQAAQAPAAQAPAKK